MRICVFGAASDNIDQKFIDLGYKLGQQIVEKGHSLVFGGGKYGMMGAVARGIENKNGEIIAVYPEWITDMQEVFEKTSLTIVTTGMDDRKKNFLKYSDAILVTPGGIGTLDEFFEVVTLKKFRDFNGPIVVFNMFNYYDKMIEMLDEMVEANFVSEEIMELIKVTDSLEDTLNSF